LADISGDEAFAPPVSSVVINAASGSRTILNAPANLPKDGLRLPDAHDIAERLLLIDGFYTAEAVTLLRGFRSRGGMICLDGGSWKADTDELLSLVSIAICSERFRPPGIESEAGTLDYLSGRGIALAAITRGQSEILAC
jgi:hypothetical protein